MVLRLPRRRASRGIRGASLRGNLCRCTGYVGIVRAIAGVVAARRARGIAAVPGGGRTRLGPAGSGNAEAAAPRASVEAAPAPETGREQRDAAPLPADWTPQTVLRRSFAVAHPPAEVWAFFGHVAAVAACLPGAAVDSVSPEGRVAGRVRIKAGPIAASFAGVADVARDAATRSGTIEGAGRDARSNSATRGRIRYAVSEADTGTFVAVEVGFTLTGMLAQFGRSGLVEDVANRLTAAFVENLEARLSGREDAPPAAELDAGSLLLAALRGRIGAAWRRLRGRL